MGLDMYIDKRSIKFTDEQYKEAQEIDMYNSNREYYIERLDQVVKFQNDKESYVESQYPEIHTYKLNPTTDPFNRIIFCGNGMLTNSRPRLYVPENDADNLHFNQAKGYDERYDWRIIDFTWEQLVDLVYENDKLYFEEAMKKYSKPRKFKEKLTDENVAYWRKANSIHNWLIKNGSNVEEDYYCHISLEKLKELKQTCIAILDDKTLAPTLLPTTSGFFFGSTNYDEWYYQDLQETINILDKIINQHTENDRYVYIASY